MTVGESALALRIAVSLPCEALAYGAAGILRQVRIVGKRSQFILHFGRDLHLDGLPAVGVRFSRSDPITIVVIFEMFDVGHSTGLSITVILSSVVTRVAGVVGHVTDED